MNIEQGSKWQYIGNDGSPVGLVHYITSAGKKSVTTWSEPIRDANSEVAGFSWMGPIEDFYKQFKPLKQ